MSTAKRGYMSVVQSLREHPEEWQLVGDGLGGRTLTHKSGFVLDRSCIPLPFFWWTAKEPSTCRIGAWGSWRISQAVKPLSDIQVADKLGIKETL